MEGYNDFLDLRESLFRAIDKYLEVSDGHCKSYEGRFRIIQMLPDYFESKIDSHITYEITLDLYVVGPNRHYSWDGNSFLEAFLKCKSDVEAWIAEFYNEEDCES